MISLEEIDQLKQSGFGRPQPRHGLKLLYWFANDCLHLNQNNVMQARCNPQNGDFGFHTFVNRYTKVGILLPNVAFPYYVLGNLSYSKAYNLPTYVREDFNRGQEDDSNMDRIIVSLNNNCFVDIYVTEHLDRWNFNKHFTYHISKHLIKIIRGLNLKEFLLKTGYLTQQTNFYPISPVEPSNQKPPCQDSGSKSESPHFWNENNIEEHDDTPSPTSTCIPVATFTSNQDLHAEIESPSSLNLGPHKASLSICSPAIIPSMTQDVQIEVDSLSQLIKNNTQEHNEASPTPSFPSPAITYSPNQDIHTEFESPSSFTNNNGQSFSTTEKNEVSYFVQDSAMQIPRNSNPQTSSKDLQTTSNNAPTIVSSRNQPADVVSSPFSGMNRSFWVVLFLFLYFFFSYFWGFVMRTTLIFGSLTYLWQNRNRGQQGQKNEREAVTTMTTKRGRMENEGQMHAVTTCTPSITFSENKITDLKSWLLLQINYCFLVFYVLNIFVFFYYIWGNVTRIFTIFVFYYHCSRSKAGKMASLTREERKGIEKEQQLS